MAFAVRLYIHQLASTTTGCHKYLLVSSCRHPSSQSVVPLLQRGCSTAGARSLEELELPHYVFNHKEQRTLNSALDIVHKLRAHEHSAYICGGWVRDKFLGRPSPDIDIATSASCLQMSKVFTHARVLPRNTMRIAVHGQEFEVTTFRGCSRAADLHSAQLDAEMRDFTMNALFYDPIDKKVLDFMGGVRDLQQRILRVCVRSTGHNEDPMSAHLAGLREDPVRVIRAMRFVTSFDMKLSKQTAESLRRTARLCSPEEGTSTSRIWRELIKIAKNETENPGSFVNSMKLAFAVGLLPCMLPSINNQESLQRALQAASHLPADLPPELRIAALLHPSGLQPYHSQIIQRFKLSEDERQNVEQLGHMAELMVGRLQDADAWLPVYARKDCLHHLQVLGAWMPDMLRQQFHELHSKRQQDYNIEIAAVQRHLLEQGMRGH